MMQWIHGNAHNKTYTYGHTHSHMHTHVCTCKINRGQSTLTFFLLGRMQRKQDATRAFRIIVPKRTMKSLREKERMRGREGGREEERK